MLTIDTFTTFRKSEHKNYKTTDVDKFGYQLVWEHFSEYSVEKGYRDGKLLYINFYIDTQVK